MKAVIHKSDSRGNMDHGWLKTWHSFSFANYMNRDRMHFGALRVFNDDIIAGGTGFGLHPHDNMEIITIMLKGELEHMDSMNHKEIIRENEVQVMSAGTGIYHSEKNASETEEVNLFQLWIFPSEKNLKPVYNQTYFDPSEAKNKWQRLVSPIGNEGLTIHQYAKISRAFVDKGETIQYKIDPESYGAYLMLIDGQISIKDFELNRRDAIGISETEDITINVSENASLLIIELPDIK